MKIMIHPDIGSTKIISEKEMIIMMDLARQTKEKLNDKELFFHFKEFEVKV